MAKSKGVSSKTHTQKQLDDYANQHNPNNKAYQARMDNDKKTCKKHKKHVVNECCIDNLEWYCYSNPYDFD